MTITGSNAPTRRPLENTWRTLRGFVTSDRTTPILSYDEAKRLAGAGLDMARFLQQNAVETVVMPESWRITGFREPPNPCRKSASDGARSVASGKPPPRPECVSPLSNDYLCLDPICPPRWSPSEIGCPWNWWIRPPSSTIGSLCGLLPTLCCFDQPPWSMQSSHPPEQTSRHAAFVLSHFDKQPDRRFAQVLPRVAAPLGAASAIWTEKTRKPKAKRRHVFMPPSDLTRFPCTASQRSARGISKSSGESYLFRWLQSVGLLADWPDCMPPVVSCREINPIKSPTPVNLTPAAPRSPR